MLWGLLQTLQGSCLANDLCLWPLLLQRRKQHTQL